MIKTIIPALLLLLASSVAAQNEPGNRGLHGTALIKLKITKQGQGYNIIFKEIVIINDEKKSPRTSKGDLNKNGLVCLFLDNSNAIVDSLFIPDPLVTRYEYPNEDGTIGSKEVHLDEKEVMIRCAYDPRMQYLQILKPADKKSRAKLATLKLPMPGSK